MFLPLLVVVLAGSILPNLVLPAEMLVGCLLVDPKEAGVLQVGVDL